MLKKTIIIGLFLVISIFAVNAAYAIDLNGTWFSNDGGTYYIRQMGNEVWWYGEAAAVSPLWSNTAHGTFDGIVALILNWADVPKGVTAGNGMLIIEVLSENDMLLIYGTGGFSGSEWAR